MSNKQVIIMSLLALISAATGIAIYKYSMQPGDLQIARQSKPIQALSIIGQRRPDFSLPDLDGKPHNIADYDGKVIVLNFWATWCPPCRKEIPAFIELQDKYRDKGFVILGVALDSQQDAIDFVDPMGINYPILLGETEGIPLSQAYGNQLSVLPYTVVIDRKGVIQHAFAREVTREQAESLITPLL